MSKDKSTTEEAPAATDTSDVEKIEAAQQSEQEQAEARLLPEDQWKSQREAYEATLRGPDAPAEEESTPSA